MRSPELLALKHAIEDRNNKLLDEDIKKREFINTSLSKEEAKALRESIREMVKDRLDIEPVARFSKRFMDKLEYYKRKQ